MELLHTGSAVVNLRAYRLLAADRLVDGMSREQVCAHFSRRILLLARRVADRAGDESPFSVEDLVSYGVMGLLEAFDRFEPDQGVEFQSFASYRILGQMLDAQRTASGTTRRERQVSRDLVKAHAEVLEALGHDPSHEDLARHLGVDLDTYWHMRGITIPVCLEPMTDEADARLGVSQAEGPRRLQAEDARRALRTALLALPVRDRQMVLLYYARDCSLAEIGAILDVTPSRVCQVLASARERLRKAIGRDFEQGLDLDVLSLEAVA